MITLSTILNSIFPCYSGNNEKEYHPSPSSLVTTTDQTCIKVHVQELDILGLEFQSGIPRHFGSKTYSICVSTIDPNSMVRDWGVVSGAYLIAMNKQALDSTLTSVGSSALGIAKLSTLFNTTPRPWVLTFMMVHPRSSGFRPEGTRPEDLRRYTGLNTGPARMMRHGHPHHERTTTTPYDLTSFPAPNGILATEFLVPSSSSSSLELMMMERQGLSPSRLTDTIPQQQPGPDQASNPENIFLSQSRFWMSDRTARACFACEKHFNWIRRRHHCRSCGLLYCFQCCRRIDFDKPREMNSSRFEQLHEQLVCMSCFGDFQQNKLVIQSSTVTTNTAESSSSVGHGGKPNILKPQRKITEEISSPSAEVKPQHSMSFTSNFKSVKTSTSTTTLAIDTSDHHTSNGEHVEEHIDKKLYSLFTPVRIVNYLTVGSPTSQGPPLWQKEYYDSNLNPQILSDAMQSRVLEGQTTTVSQRLDQELRPRSLSDPKTTFKSSSYKTSSNHHSSFDKKNDVHQVDENKLNQGATMTTTNFNAEKGRSKSQECLSSTTKKFVRRPIHGPREPLPLPTKVTTRKTSRRKCKCGVPTPHLKSTTIGLLPSASSGNDGDQSSDYDSQSMEDHRTIHHLVSHALISSNISIRSTKIIIPNKDDEIPTRDNDDENVHRWIETLVQFAHRAAMSITIQHNHEHPDILNYLSIQHQSPLRLSSSGSPQLSSTSSRYIDGVYFHNKSFSRKTNQLYVQQASSAQSAAEDDPGKDPGTNQMFLRNPRILLIASDLQFQRTRRHFCSLEDAGAQEMEYMHILIEKIMLLKPTIICFRGHVHHLAEDLFHQRKVLVIKQVPRIVLQQLARSLNAMLLFRVDHVDKFPGHLVLGQCQMFKVLAKTSRSDSNSGTPTTTTSMNTRKKRKRNPLRYFLSFEGGNKRRQGTVILSHNYSQEIQDQFTNVLSLATRVAYNIRLERSCYGQFGRIRRLTLSKSCSGEFPHSSSSPIGDDVDPDPDPDPSSSSDAELIVSMCWSPVVWAANKLPKKCSMAVLRRIRYYQPQEDCALGEFLERFCFGSSRPTTTTHVMNMNPPTPSSKNTKNRSKPQSLDHKSMDDLKSSHSSNHSKFTAAAAPDEYQKAFEHNRLTFTHHERRIVWNVIPFSSSSSLDGSFRNSKKKHEEDQETFPPECSTKSKSSLNNWTHLSTQFQTHPNVIFMWMSEEEIEIHEGTQEVSMVENQASTFMQMQPDTYRYSLGKFLEDLFVGNPEDFCASLVYTSREASSTTSTCKTNKSLVYYFGCNDKIVQIHVEPISSISSIDFQPTYVDSSRPVKKKNELMPRVDQEELFQLLETTVESTITKISNSEKDVLVCTEALRKNLKVMKNEVLYWSNDLRNRIKEHEILSSVILYKHMLIKDMYENAMEWSSRLSQLMQSRVNPQMMAAVVQTTKTTKSKQSIIPNHPPSPSTSTTDVIPPSTMNMMNHHQSSTGKNIVEPSKGLPKLWLNEFAAMKEDQIDRQILESNNNNGASSHINNLKRTSPSESESGHSPVPVSSLAEMAKSIAAAVNSPVTNKNESVPTTTTQSVKPHSTTQPHPFIPQQADDGHLGVFSMPVYFIEHHLSLERGFDHTVILVNVCQPTSVISYALASTEVIMELQSQIQKCMGTLSSRSSTIDTHQALCFHLLREPLRNDVVKKFQDEWKLNAVTKFSCTMYYPLQFRALRELRVLHPNTTSTGIPHDRVCNLEWVFQNDLNFIESLSHCCDFDVDGGKSGADFMKTSDERYIAKIIPAIELQMFLSMATEYFEYQARVLDQHLPSMLSTILGVFEIQIKKSSGLGNVNSSKVTSTDEMMNNHHHHHSPFDPLSEESKSSIHHPHTLNPSTPAAVNLNNHLLNPTEGVAAAAAPSQGRRLSQTHTMTEPTGASGTSSSGHIEKTLHVLIMENLFYGKSMTNMHMFDLKGKMEGRYKKPRAPDVMPLPSSSTNIETTEVLSTNHHQSASHPEGPTNTPSSFSSLLNHGTGPLSAGMKPSQPHEDTKRFALSDGEVWWDRNFIEYFQALPLSIEPRAHARLMRAVELDSRFLSSVEITDYSMLVGLDLESQEMVCCIIDYIHSTFYSVCSTGFSFQP